MAGGTGVQVSEGPKCGAGIRYGEQIRSIIDIIQEIKRENKEQWDAIERLKNRLPVWATLFVSSLTGVIGVLVGLLVAKSGG